MYQRQNASTLSALFHFSAQPKKCHVWLANYCEYIMILVINGELGQFALYHQHNGMTCGCLAFAFPAVPHFNNRYLRVACSPSRASTAASTEPSTRNAPREVSSLGFHYFFRCQRKGRGGRRGTPSRICGVVNIGDEYFILGD